MYVCMYVSLCVSMYALFNQFCLSTGTLSAEVAEVPEIEKLTKFFESMKTDLMATVEKMTESLRSEYVYTAYWPHTPEEKAPVCVSAHTRSNIQHYRHRTMTGETGSVRWGSERPTTSLLGQDTGAI